MFTLYYVQACNMASPKAEQAFFFQHIEKNVLHLDHFDPSLVFSLYSYTLVYCSLFFGLVGCFLGLFPVLFAMQEAEHNHPEIWMQINRNP